MLHSSHKILPADFSQRLRELTDPPQHLYTKGNTALLDAPKTLAIVGSRRMTSYGKRVCASLIPPLIRHGIVIVSGLAYGVDAEAHTITLQQHGSAIAVLGSGIDIITPQCNERLGKAIAENGLLVSEYPGEMPGQKYTYPARNRIIAALSDAVVIVEGMMSSGSLITADFAMQLGRDVFTVPGPIDAPMSQGPNWLISHGCHCLTSATDLLQYFGISEKNTDSHATSPIEKKILLELQNTAQTIDQLHMQCNCAREEIITACVALELAGTISRDATGSYHVSSQ